MKLRFVRAVSGVLGAFALLLAVTAVIASEGAVQVLGADDQAQVVGGGETCAGSGNCTVCSGPTCKVVGQNCEINVAGSAACSASATIKMCVPGTWYQSCSYNATGLCGSSQNPVACPPSQGCPPPNPGCSAGGNFGCGGC